MHSNPACSGAKSGLRPSSPRPAGVPTWSRRAGEWGAFVFAAFALLGTSPASVGLAVWIKLLLFFPFAYWAGGRSQPVGWLLFLALLGFTVGFLHNVDWASFDATFFYTRFEVYLPAVAFGMFSGVAVLGLIAIRESFWVSGTSRIPGWARIAIWLLLLAIMLEALFLSFSRTTWIAFAIAAALLMYLEWRTRRRDRGQRQQTATIPRLASALVVAIVALLVFGTVSECRNGNVHRPFCRFLLVTLVFILIWNLTNYRIVRHDGLFFWIIFAGIAYSCRLRVLIADAREGSISANAGSPA